MLSGLTEDEMMVFDGKNATEKRRGDGKDCVCEPFLVLSCFLPQRFSCSSFKKKKKTAFEGEEYYKHDVTATLLPNGGREGSSGASNGEGDGEGEAQRVSTFLYCWSDSARAQLLPEDWSYSRFREEHLSRYVEMCAGFEEELREEARAASAAARSSGGE